MTSKSRPKKPERRLGIGQVLVDHGLLALGIAEVHTNKNMRTVEDGTYLLTHELVRNVMRRSRDVLSIEAGAFSLPLEVARSGNRR